MSGFRYITFISILAEIYTGIVLVVQMPKYLNYTRAHPDTYIQEKFIFDLNFFEGASIVFFAYTCSAQLFPIYSELIRPSDRRIKKVISRAHFIDIGFYYLIALPGYFSTFSQTPKLVLDRPHIPGDNSQSYALMVAQAL